MQLQRILLRKITDVPAEEFIRYATAPIGEYREFVNVMLDVVGEKLYRERIVPGIIQRLRADGTMGIELTRSIFAVYPPREIEIPILLIASPELSREQPGYQQAVEFVRSQPVFTVNYDIVANLQSHSILFKKVRGRPDTMEYIDSTGASLATITGQGYMTFFRAFFQILGDAGITEFVRRPCALTNLQTAGTCFMWSTLFSLFFYEPQEEVLRMIDTLLERKAIQITTRTREAVIIVLFREIIERGFIDASRLPEDYIIEYRKGLGKCRKCGLLKK